MIDCCICLVEYPIQDVWSVIGIGDTFRAYCDGCLILIKQDEYKDNDHAVMGKTSYICTEHSDIN